MMNPNTDSYNKFVSESRRIALMDWAGKIAVGLISPVAIGIGKADPKGRAIYTQYEKLNTPANPFAGTAKFYHDHPDMFGDTLGTTTTTHGNYLPENKELYNVVEDPKNTSIINKYPLAAWGLIGGIDTKDKNYYEPALTATVNDGLRKRLMPDDFIKNLQIAIGNQWYYDMLDPWYETVKGKSGAYEAEQQYIKSYGRVYNPTWLAQFQSNTSQDRAWSTYNQFLEMLKDPSVKEQYPKQIEQINKLMESDFLPAIGQLMQYQQEAATGSRSYAEIKQWWQDGINSYLTDPKYAAIKPALISVLAPLG